MSLFPVPTEAYWATVPWWGFLGFCLIALVIGTIVGPWLIQRVRNSPAARLSREEALIAREARLTEDRDAYLADVTTERDDLRKKQREIEADRDLGWDLARAVEIKAHQLYHALCNMIEERNGALTLAKRAIDGTMRPEVALELLKERAPVQPPKPLQTLRDMDRKRPDETPYA